jgi:oligoendopeptidase F
LNLHSRISQASSYIRPELLALSDTYLSDAMNDPEFSPYRFYLEKIVRNKPHTLSGDIEQVLAMESELFQVPRQVFSQLDNADLTFGTIVDEDGKKIELSHGNFISFLNNPNREIREKAFRQYYATYDSHRFTLAATLSSSIKKDVILSKVRHFNSCLMASLFQDNVDETIYDTLLSTVKDNLNPLFDYFSFRREVLGVPELHFYDTYVPIVDGVEFKLEYDEAVDICVKALAPLGGEYTALLTSGLTGGWVDRYENKGKRSGAYSSGCYDSPPYILMNYEKKSMGSLYTLIHEAGHSMHSHYSRTSQPYATHDYTIFVAEVASTLNEILLSHHLLEIYDHDPKMKAYILNREIDNIRATLFRQTMFAEFEKVTHHLSENNQPLTLDVLRTEYRKLLTAYFGTSIVIDDELTLECLRIPHFYSAFYVYKYATGISAAIAIAERIINNEKDAVEDYLAFLKTGGSMFPIDELMVAGVDMRSPVPIRNAIRHFEKRINDFKAVWTSHLKQ